MKKTILVLLFVFCSHSQANFVSLNEGEAWVTDFKKLPSSLIVKYQRLIKESQKLKKDPKYQAKHDVSEDLDLILKHFGLKNKAYAVDFSRPSQKQLVELQKVTLWIHLDDKTKGDCYTYPNHYIEFGLSKRAKGFAGIFISTDEVFKELKLDDNKQEVSDFLEYIMDDKRFKSEIESHWDFSPKNEKAVSIKEHMKKRIKVYQYGKQKLFWAEQPVIDFGSYFFFATKLEKSTLKMQDAISYTPCGT
jgi:predicted CopG family antitoxin